VKPAFVGRTEARPSPRFRTNGVRERFCAGRRTVPRYLGATSAKNNNGSPPVFDSLSTSLSEPVIALRLVLAVGLGAAIGYERERLDRPAGLRTHMLTALAAALFTVLTLEIHAGLARSGANNADPIRIIEAVTAGVAFLAAGAIFRSGGDVHGLTTGAGMWLAGAIGVACGGGYYVVAVMATLLAAFILAVLRRFEHRLGTKEPQG
jgi:putative Mg2+ transporter-C (MgtC) family protein